MPPANSLGIVASAAPLPSNSMHSRGRIPEGGAARPVQPVRPAQATQRTRLSSAAASGAESSVAWPVPRATLTRWNVAMFLFHTCLATLTLTVGRLDLRVQVYRTTLEFRRRGINGTGVGWDLIPAYAPQGHLPFTVLTGAFFLLSATFHLLNASLLRSLYLRELEQCRTPTRWVEYTLSAPLMFVLIAYSLGIRDRVTLFALAALIAATMPFGYWTETNARPLSATSWSKPLRLRLLPWALGHIPQTAAWLVVVVQFYSSTASPEDTIPWWVHLILWAELALFFSFGVASVVSQVSPPRRFYQGELCFQVLSLVSKGLLGLVLLSNVLMLSRFEDVYET